MSEAGDNRFYRTKADSNPYTDQAKALAALSAENGLLRAEVERLTANLALTAEQLQWADDEIGRKQVEIEQLREALREIHDLDARFGMAHDGEKWMVAWCISGKALGAVPCG